MTRGLGCALAGLGWDGAVGPGTGANLWEVSEGTSGLSVSPSHEMGSADRLLPGPAPERVGGGWRRAPGCGCQSRPQHQARTELGMRPLQPGPGTGRWRGLEWAVKGRDLALSACGLWARRAWATAAGAWAPSLATEEVKTCQAPGFPAGCLGAGQLGLLWTGSRRSPSSGLF